MDLGASAKIFALSSSTQGKTRSGMLNCWNNLTPLAYKKLNMLLS